MTIPTEPIGSPRPTSLIEAVAASGDNWELQLQPPSLFELKVGRFYIALAEEQDRDRVLRIVQQYMKPNHRVFVGVVSPINPRIETPAEIRDRIREAAKYIPVDQLEATDNCGFWPFSDDLSTSRDTAFAKIRSRVEGAELAARAIGGG